MCGSGGPSSHRVIRKGEVSELTGKIKAAWNSTQLCLLPQSFASPWHAFFAHPCACKPLSAVQLRAGKDRGMEKPCRRVCFNADAIIRKQAKLRIACLGRLRVCGKQETWRNICIIVKRERKKAKLSVIQTLGHITGSQLQPELPHITVGYWLQHSSTLELGESCERLCKANGDTLLTCNFAGAN